MVDQITNVLYRSISFRSYWRGSKESHKQFATVLDRVKLELIPQFVWFSFSLKYFGVKYPGKKTKQAATNEITTNKTESFVLLYDEKNSRHAIFAHDQLVFAKKDNLKVDTYATFSGNGDRSSKCRGIVVSAGKPSEKN